ELDRKDCLHILLPCDAVRDFDPRLVREGVKDRQEFRHLRPGPRTDHCDALACPWGYREIIHGEARHDIRDHQQGNDDDEHPPRRLRRDVAPSTSFRSGLCTPLPRNIPPRGWNALFACTLSVVASASA